MEWFRFSLGEYNKSNDLISQSHREGKKEKKSENEMYKYLLTRAPYNDS